MDGYTFLSALAIVLGVAAVTTLLFLRLHLPIVLGYILAGMIVGPYVPVPLVANRAVVGSLSELGVTLLMFSIGLEFSLRKLVRVGPTAGLITVFEVSCMISLGYLGARLLGWTPMEAVFTGAVVAIASSMIIAKLFAEKRPDRDQTELVFGVAVCEDLAAILLLTALTAISSGGLSARVLTGATGRLALFLLLLVGIGLLVIPRLVRGVARHGNNETLVVLSIGLCCAVALLSHGLGYSLALGSFVCGSLVAESGLGGRIEPLVHPLRDLFGAVFFVSVGMSIDPHLLPRYWLPVLALTGVVVLGKLVSVTLGALLTGHSLRVAVASALSLAQIGEFSFILAGLAVSQGAARPFLYPVAVGVSVMTALLSPLLTRAALPLAAYLDRHLPRPLQNWLTLYAAWLRRLRSEPLVRRSQLRRLALLVALDAVCLAGLCIGAALTAQHLPPILSRWGQVTPILAQLLLAAVALLLSVPFWVGMVRTSRRLARELARRALPLAPAGQADLGAAPRRALTVTLHILILLLVGLPLWAVTQPFLPRVTVLLLALLWVVPLTLCGLIFWRSATDLLGHVRAGTEVVLELLAAQSRATDHGPGEPLPPPPALPESLLAGIGPWVSHRVAATDRCVGQSLAQLNLRGLTGATVLAILRQPRGIAAPAAHEVLRADDVLALSGSSEALARAAHLLRGTSAAPAEIPAAGP
jgi:CPA2 family monovalent cation:H+ antiporter-2